MSEINNSSGQSAAELLSNELLSFCKSDSLSEEGLRKIIERHTPNEIFPHYFPDAATATDENWLTPLHHACKNKNATLNIVRILIDAAPDSGRSVSTEGWMPLHYLCQNKHVDEASAMKILKLLIEKCPEAVRHTDNRGRLPIHYAAEINCPEFCRLLIEAYPGSEQMTSAKGDLPFHLACYYNSLATVEYLHGLHPDTINIASRRHYPIHIVMDGMKQRENRATAVEIVHFLLGCDPIIKLQKSGKGRSLLHYACRKEYIGSNIEAGIQIIGAIYDAYPEAIEKNGIASDIHRYHQQVQSFINNELVYARQAKDLRLMTRSDDNQQLPLHRALQNNASLGSIKLLVKGNPHAIQSSDNNGALPLHIACQHHDCASVVQYLLGLDEASLDSLDEKGNTALHHACFGAKHDTIALLLEEYDAVSVSKRNAHDKLPTELLWESGAVLDRESIEYTESVFLLLKAYPETIMSGSMNMKQQVNSGERPSQNGKKRKYGDTT